MTLNGHWRDIYIDAATAAMTWVLDRPRLDYGFINTKYNVLSRSDYGSADGLRGPDFTYGWIQGRGLEAMAGHARVLGKSNPDLAARLRHGASALHETMLAQIRQKQHVYFCYDKHLTPVVASPEGAISEQSLAPEFYTYADIFAAKGLLAAAITFDFPGRDVALEHLLAAVEAVENGQFQIDERRRIEKSTIAEQPDDFGPRMILLGAADLLVQFKMPEYAGFGDRFVEHVLSRHYDATTGFLRNVPAGAVTNIGHAIEFTGFALSLLPATGDPDLRLRLDGILHSSFAAGFTGHGLALEVDVASGIQLSEFTPWWSLPETIRAAALSFEHAGNQKSRDIWRKCHEAFFRHFWQATPPIAHQMLSRGVPVDVVPATPDLDPGYHTGLCLLSAVSTLDRMAGVQNSVASD